MRWPLWRGLARRHAVEARVSAWDRWIDPALAHSPEGGPRATARVRAELTARRDAATAEFGPLP